MLKIIGGALITVMAAYLGYAINSIYVYRAKFLEQNHQLIDFAEGEIDFFRTDIMSLIKKFCTSFDNELSLILAKVNTVEELLNKELIENNRLSDEQKEFLRSIFLTISEMDRNSQKINFLRLRKELDVLQQKNNSDIKNKGHLWQKLTPLLGIGLFILII